MAKKQEFTKEEIEETLKNSLTYKEMAQKLGYKCSSPFIVNYINKLIKNYNLDDNHINKDNVDSYDLSIFKQGFVGSTKLFKTLIYLRGHKCEMCGNEKWLGQKIKLEVHHKDGDHYNNILDNLQLLCPNCHSMTENWRGKGIKNKDSIPETMFIEALKTTASIRQALLKLHLTACGANYVRAKKLIIKYNIENQKKQYNSVEKSKNIRKNNNVKNLITTSFCKNCGKPITLGSKLCIKCYRERLSLREPKIPIPTKQELLQTFDNCNYNREEVANHYKVSGNLIRKWCNKLNIDCQNKKVLKLLYRQEILGLDLDKHIGPNKPKCTKIAQLDPNTGEVIKIYESKAAAGRAMGCSSRNLGMACDKPNRTAMGYKWSLKLANNE